MTHSVCRPLTAVLSLVLVVGSACTSTPAGANDADPTEPEPASTSYGPDLPAGSATEEVARICDEFAEAIAGVEEPLVVGVLPFVYHRTSSESTVPELGVDLANFMHSKLHEQLNRKGPVILAPDEMAAQLSVMNVNQVALHSLPSVLSEGARLGVDVVLFGSFRKTDGGRRGKDLVFNVYLQEVLSGRRVNPKRNFVVPNKGAVNTPVFTKVEQPSTWSAVDSLPSVGGTLDDELGVMMQMIARSLSRKDAFAAVGKDEVVYVAPANSQNLSQEVAGLRSSQADYWDEEARVFNGPADAPSTWPVVVGGKEYVTLEHASSMMAGLREQVMRGPAMRFAKSMAYKLVDPLKDHTATNRVVRDLTFLPDSNTDVLEDKLATGGLFDHEAMVRHVRRMGVRAVVQLEIEEYASHHEVRANIYDLETRELASTAAYPVRPEYFPALRDKLAGVTYSN